MSAGGNGRPQYGRFALDVPAPAKAKMLSDWIVCLEADLPALSSEAAANREKDSAFAWASNILDLAACFLQVVRIPCFERFEIVGFTKAAEKQGVNIAFRMPDPVLISSEFLEQILKVAIAIASWTIDKNPSNLDARSQFFQLVNDNVLVKFFDKTPRGKSTYQVLRAAHDLRIPFFRLPGGVYQLGLGSHACRINRSTTDRDSALGSAWSKNKLLSAALMRQAGFPVPKHALVSTSELAKETALRIGYPVVIKPADLERGEGVSVDVDESSIAEAFELARDHSPGNQVIVEEQISGVCHRLFVVRETLLYAVKRLPIGVYADGVSTVKDLVEAECQVQQMRPPWKRSGIQPLDRLACMNLKSANLTPETVPQVGTFITLRRIETTAWGGVDEDVTDVIHPDNVKLATQVAKLCALDVVGVDLISADITKPWHSNGAAVNEINFAPLLGGGEISKRQIGSYLDCILVNKGRIPIHIYDGSEDTRQRANAKWVQLRSAGLNTFLVTEAELFDGTASRQHLCVVSLEQRVRALVLRQDVQGIVIIAKNSEQAGIIKNFLKA